LSGASVKSDRSTMMPTPDEDSGDEDSGVRPALWSVALSGAVLTLASPFVFGRPGVLGVALGSLLAFVNLWALARIVRAFVNGAGLPWALLAGFKLVALLAVVGLILHLGLTTVIPLAVGYGALPIGIVLGQLGSARAATRPATLPGYSSEIDGDSQRKG